MSGENPTNNGACKCGKPGFRFRGERWLCVQHNRMEMMITTSKERGLRVPTKQELEAMFFEVESNGMKCPHCGIKMNWSRSDGMMSVLSLQHDRSGDLRLICMGCNVRHAAVPGDRFFDIPLDHKHCPQCKTVKLIESNFYRLSSGNLSSWCRACRKRINKQMWASYGRVWAANAKERSNASR
jgi:hypothetical protein